MIDRIAGHSFLKRPITHDAVVVDLGVNHAEFSSEVAERYGCRIVGVEPVPALYGALPPVPRADFDRAALTSDGKPVTLYINRGVCATVVDGLRRADAEQITVPGVTLDDLLQRHGLSRVALVKIDIEGAELGVLESIPAETLERIDQLSVEFHDFLDASQEPAVRRCRSRLRRLGFISISLSRDNSDVLFVNRQRSSLSVFALVWLVSRYRYGRGVHRMARRVTRRVFSDKVAL
jgi:FkbM family methyltransferase